ncbi:MAG TPA: barstar family protein [Burkholderiales bacterium]|nr:barstar family protein [Burkholderiales bacterium]
MGKLLARLQDASRSGVYRARRADEIMDAVKDSKLVRARIRFADKESLLRNIAAALDFPSWFGHNWDALEDCLSDLPGEGHVLLIENAKAGDDLGVLIDVLRSSASSRAARGKPFFAVFIDPARELELPPLFTEK